MSARKKRKTSARKTRRLSSSEDEGDVEFIKCERLSTCPKPNGHQGRCKEKGETPKKPKRGDIKWRLDAVTGDGVCTFTPIVAPTTLSMFEAVGRGYATSAEIFTFFRMKEMEKQRNDNPPDDDDSSSDIEEPEGEVPVKKKPPKKPAKPAKQAENDDDEIEVVDE